MSWLSKLLSSSAGSFVDSVSKSVKRFITTEEDRNEFTLELEQLLQQRDSEVEQTIRAELTAKERILVAELQQGDNYTKRARPTVVYAGLAFITLNYVVMPLIGRIALVLGATDVDTSPLADLPAEFWAAWGGICATWIIGRSAEKRGVRNKLVNAVTGTAAPQSRLLD